MKKSNNNISESSCRNKPDDNLSTTTLGSSAGGSNSIAINPPMAYGWICPKCGRVNAPWKDHCDCSGATAPSAPPNTPPPLTPDYVPYIPHTPYYNPPTFPDPSQTNPYAPYGPYKWGDAPGWWQWGPTCKGGGLGNPIPCSQDEAKKIMESNGLTTSITSTSDPNIKYSLWSYSLDPSDYTTNCDNGAQEKK